MASRHPCMLTLFGMGAFGLLKTQGLYAKAVSIQEKVMTAATYHDQSIVRLL